MATNGGKRTMGALLVLGAVMVMLLREGGESPVSLLDATKTGPGSTFLVLILVTVLL